jgi:hypothetical protein
VADKLLILWLIILPILFNAATSVEYELSGSISFESRWFPHNAQFPDQFEGAQNSLALEPEWDVQINDNQLLSFIPFARLDARDDRRTHTDIREAYWLYINNDWELLVGINREFWGVTESRHLVNIINQVDQVENIDEEDFLGQPMINYVLQKDYGRFSFFVLPYFRERTFPGEDGRLRSAIVAREDGEYESSTEQWHTDAAFRYTHYMGNWDIGLSYFYGTGREPTLFPNTNGTRLIPHYDIINQAGLDLQYTDEAWLWKFEGIIREGQGDTFAASVAGFEYTFFQAFESNADLGLLAEHLYDGRDETGAPQTVLENDLFLGMRYTFNDVQDTNLLAGTIVDLEDESYSVRVEGERRLGDTFKLELEGQLFANTRSSSNTASVKDDDFITLRLSRFF